MDTFYTWPDKPPKKCQTCGRRLRTTFVFGDTKMGLRHVVMCEKCFAEFGSPRAMYGEPRRYARVNRVWVTADKPDWDPEEIPDGTECEIENRLTGGRSRFRYKKPRFW
jgi:hypothetical protein